MPKHAVNTTEQARIRKLFLAGNPATAIAAHMNIDLDVVENWHPDKVAERKVEIRAAEAVLMGQKAEQETKDAEEEAAALKRSEAGKKAAATREANRKLKKDAAKLDDQRKAEERDKAQEEMAALQSGVAEG